MFQWTDYIEVAKIVRDLDAEELAISEEALYRTAVSRAYYAAYKTANDWLDVHCSYKVSKDQGSHEDMISFLCNHISEAEHVPHIRRWLESLKNERMAADYREATNFSVWVGNKQRIDKAITMSRKVCDKLKACTPTS